MEYSPMLYLRLLTGTDSVSQEHFNFNFATVDSALQDFEKILDSFDPEVTDDDLKKLATYIQFSSETLAEIGGSVVLNSAQLQMMSQYLTTEQLETLSSYLSISPEELEEMVKNLSDSQLETMGESVSLTEEQIQTFLGGVELTDSQLASIVNGADEETLQEIADKINLSLSDLQGICEKLSDSQLEKMGESVVLTEEQIQTFLGDVELTESQLASILNHADEETLQEIADKINLSLSDLQGICEKLSDSQLEKMGESVVLTEEQIATFLGEVELTDSQLASIVNGANEETLQIIADKMQLSVSDLQGICEKLSDSQLKKMGESVSLTEEQIATFLGDVELTDSQLASIVNGADDETLKEIADKIEFSQDILSTLKGEKGDDGESAAFTPEQEGLITAAITGAVEKQEKFNLKDESGEYIIPTVESVKEEAKIPLLQDDSTGFLDFKDLVKYVGVQVGLPSSGKSLDDYSWEEIWQIAQLGLMQDYFQVGDKKSWGSDRLFTTCQIADFNVDVKDKATGQRANVTFILNDFVLGTTSEVNSVYMSSKSSFIANNSSCFAAVIELQENGSITQDLMPPALSGLITPVFKATDAGGWSKYLDDNITLLGDDYIYSSYFSPLGIREIYGANMIDRYDGKTKNQIYSIFNTGVNPSSILNTYQAPETSYLRTRAPTTSTIVNYMTTSGEFSTATATMTTTVNAFVRRLYVSFCMG